VGQPFEIGARSVDVRPCFRADGFDLVIDGERVAADLVDHGGGRFTLDAGERSRALWLAVDGDRIFVHTEGHHFEVRCVDALARIQQATRSARGGGELHAPMPGVVVEIRAAVGARVAEGDTVLVVESMKLQTPIAADRDGRVAELGFEEGQSFDQGSLLARIEPESREEESG